MENSELGLGKNRSEVFGRIRMKRICKYLIGGLILGVLGVLVWVRGQGELVNPLGKETGRNNLMGEYRVVGFLPTWMVGKTMDYCDQITDMVFLGVEVDEEGRLIEDGAWQKLKGEEYGETKKRFDKCGGRNILGVKLFDDNKIDVFINSAEARGRFIRELGELVAEDGFDGVNIDFEYQGDPTAVLGDDFVGFMKELKEANLGELSIDVFANTILRGPVSQILALMEAVDYIIVMAYDFHRPGMDFAGPVSPIRSVVGERNVWEVVERVVAIDLDKKKMVMAFPLYGYEWKTETVDFGARVKRGWWALASYKRMKEFLVGEGQWDEKSMTPWLVYEENGEIKQVYYENLESLKRKFSLVESSQWGGIGFWALGYEGDYEEVWVELREILGG